MWLHVDIEYGHTLIHKHDGNDEGDNGDQVQEDGIFSQYDVDIEGLKYAILLL